MKTIETKNYIIEIDKFIDIIYIQITPTDVFVKEVIDNIMLYNRNQNKQIQ